MLSKDSEVATTVAVASCFHVGRFLLHFLRIFTGGGYMNYITFENLMSFCLLIVAIVTLCLSGQNKKK